MVLHYARWPCVVLNVCHYGLTCCPTLCRDGPVWSYTLLRGSSVALHIAERAQCGLILCKKGPIYGASLC